MKVVSAVSVIAALIAAMAGFVYLSVKGIDTTAFVAFAGAVLLPQAVQMFRQDKTQQDVAIIKQRTNGPLDRQAETLTEMSQKLDALGQAVEELKGGENDARSS